MIFNNSIEQNKCNFIISLLYMFLIIKFVEDLYLILIFNNSNIITSKYFRRKMNNVNNILLVF